MAQREQVDRIFMQRCPHGERPDLPRGERLASCCSCSESLSAAAGHRVLLRGDYVDAVKIRPREAADQAAARAFLARHNSLCVARPGRRGFCLVRVHRGAVDRSRVSLKPEIPQVGAYGIPLRDEIELERQP
jgi:hypothetical protein